MAANNKKIREVLGLEKPAVKNAVGEVTETSAEETGKKGKKSQSETDKAQKSKAAKDDSKKPSKKAGPKAKGPSNGVDPADEPSNSSLGTDSPATGAVAEDQAVEQILKDSLKRTAQSVNELAAGEEIISGNSDGTASDSNNGDASASNDITGDDTATDVADNTTSSSFHIPSDFTVRNNANGDPSNGSAASSADASINSSSSTTSTGAATGANNASSVSSNLFIRSQENLGDSPKGGKEMGEMKDLKFYDTVGDAIYDFDRGLTMSPALRDWIMEALSRDKILAREAAISRLADILGENPELIPSVKQIVQDVANSNVAYRVTYISNLDGTEYESRTDAEQAIAPYRAIGATFESSYKKAYRKINVDGTSGDRVSVNEVEDYVNRFEGDKKRLRALLLLEDRDSDQGDSQDSQDSQTDSSQEESD